MESPVTPAFQINCITYNNQATSAGQVYQGKRFLPKKQSLEEINVQAGWSPMYEYRTAKIRNCHK